MTRLGYFQEIWSSIRDGSARLNLLRTLEEENGDVASLAEHAHRLITTRGEATSLLCAEQFLDCYKSATPEDKLEFFRQLLKDYDLDPDQLLSVVSVYHSDRKPEDYAAIFAACTTRRQRLFSKLHEAPDGIHQLVLLRADLRRACKQDPSLRPIDVDLKSLFLSWFNRGFLSLRPIDWTTPAHILEKIIAYEAVHEIGTWSELRKRLEPTDRRCYAFFHLAMPDEPLIFVEVALTTEIPHNIQHLLDGERTPIDSDNATVAVFYSISNCQPGLAGISFGNFLIKQVARELSAELPALKDFVTLSPIPGFKNWLLSTAVDDKDVAKLLETLDQPDWLEQTTADKSIELQLKKLAAKYLVQTQDANGQPANAVARFHLGNGARVERLNFPGDTTENGKRQSASMMVNYYYDLGKVAQYHEDFALQGKIAYSKEVKSLLDGV